MMIDIEDATARKQLIETITQWAQKDTSVRLNDLSEYLKMPRHIFLEWVKKYPDLYDAYYQIKMITARRRKVQTRDSRNFIVVPRGKRVDSVSSF